MWHYHNSVKKLCITALYSGLLVQSVPPASGAASSQDSCAAPSIDFAPLEPQQFTWFTGRKQTSKMFEDGKTIAEFALRYRNTPVIEPSMKASALVIQVQEQKFKYSTTYGEDSII
jgi:hypothetical protein